MRIDGPLARAVQGRRKCCRAGPATTLDLVVDFTTYVFVPAYAIAASGLMPHALGRSGRRRDRNHRRALFRRPQDEDRRQLFSRLSGGVESDRVLSSAAAAGALDRGRDGRAVRGADLRAGALRASVPGAAAAPVTVALLTLWAVLALAAVKQGLAPELWINRVVRACRVFPAIGLLPQPDRSE